MTDLGYLARFWGRVDKETGPIHPVHGRCWPWLAGRSSSGYGKINFLGKQDGVPLLRADEEGPEAVAELGRMLAIAERYYPASAPPSIQERGRL